MKKLLILSLFGVLCAPAFAATSTSTLPWWLQPTICRISTTQCYASMGIGFDADAWDAAANCRGMKMVCPDALVAGGDGPVTISKTELSNKSKIKEDYDITALANGCFGARKTSANGTEVSVNGKNAKVWCYGVLDNPTETVANGEITNGAEPTCNELAQNGYAAVLNGKCYGKYYNPTEYYIECGTAQLPSQLIVLNGADYMTPPSAKAPKTPSEAKSTFDSMYQVSRAQHEKYFKTTD